MKKRLFFFIVAMLIPFYIWAQDKPDVNGWNGACWGMMENELKNIFGDQLVRSKDRQYIDGNKIYRDLEITKYVINNTDFKVLFEMGSTDNKLKRVRLVHQSAIPSQFSEFEQLLSAKYGPPMQKDESGSRSGTDKNSSWLLPSTKIELVYIVVPRFFTILNITYTDRSYLKGDLDKL
jgi:hypothetical protein